VGPHRRRTRNFGIVARCWFRSPDASGTDTGSLLPKAPDSVLTFRVAWNWEDMDEAAFTRLVRNHGAWCERNSAPDSPYARLFSILFLHRRQYGRLELRGLSTAGAGAERLFDEHLAAINEGIGVPHTREVERTSWLSFALNPFPELFKAGMDNDRSRCAGRHAGSRDLRREHQHGGAGRDRLGYLRLQQIKSRWDPCNVFHHALSIRPG
jgi:hypothetical protein